LRAEVSRVLGADDFLIACREIFERNLVNGFAMTSCMRRS